MNVPSSRTSGLETNLLWPLITAMDIITWAIAPTDQWTPLYGKGHNSHLASIPQTLGGKKCPPTPTKL